MTTYSEQTVKCRLCNHSQTVYLLCSYSSFGAPDLDARPAEMARGAIMSMLQVCPECGYAAFDISNDVGNTEAVKKLLAGFPKSESMSDDYYRAGEIARQISNDHGDAFVYYLRAAWSADDEKDAQKAKEMRSLALKEEKTVGVWKHIRGERCHAKHHDLDIRQLDKQPRPKSGSADCPPLVRLFLSRGEYDRAQQAPRHPQKVSGTDPRQKAYTLA